MYDFITSAGYEAGKYVPGFLTAKVTPQPVGDPLEHHMVCIIGVKRKHLTVEEATEQMTQYMLQVAEHSSREEGFRGYLLIPNHVVPFQLERQGFGWEIVQGEAFDMFADGDRFTRELCEIAGRNWNDPH